VVSRYFRAEPQLGNRDRALIAESAFAILRRKNEMSQFASSGSGTQARRLALLGMMSALSEGGLGSANRPESALADLAHVIQPSEYDWLKRYSELDRDTLAPMVRNNLPEWLWNAFESSPGEAQRQELAIALMRPALLDLRVNTIKANRDTLLEEMIALWVSLHCRIPAGLRKVFLKCRTKAVNCFAICWAPSAVRWWLIFVRALEARPWPWAR
jgi:16S rRNA (cytosine967-C5)-methyltransferase